MTFECRLQGNFDEILLHIERTVMIDEEEASNTSTENTRMVVRKYNSGAGFTLTQSGEDINVIVTCNEGGMFGTDIYFELIKDAVKKYSVDMIEDIITEPISEEDVYSESIDIEKNDEDYTYTKGITTDTSLSNDIEKEDFISVEYNTNDMKNSDDIKTSEANYNINDTKISSDNYETEANKDINSLEISNDEKNDELNNEKCLIKLNDDTKAGTLNNELKAEDIKLDNATGEAIKLVCKCDKEYIIELYKSTFEHIKKDLWNPLGESAEKEYYVKSTYWWRNNTYVCRIVEKLEAVFTINNFDYYTMCRGVFCIVIGTIMAMIGAQIKFEYIGLDYLFFYLCAQVIRLFMIYQAFRGVMYILPISQKWYRIFEWSFSNRFVFRRKLVPVGGSYMPDGSKGITKTNEMILYDQHVKFYFETRIKTIHYSDCVNVFETENFFVIMVQNNYILSFQKSDISLEQQDLIRERFSPYYKKETSYSTY